MKLGVTASLALAGALASAGFLAIPGSAQATLHGFCSTAAPCTDTGTNTPTSVNPPDFGFSAGGHSAMGDVMIDILVPDTISSPSTTYTISGPLISPATFTASLFSTTPWTLASHPMGDPRWTLISAYREARITRLGLFFLPRRLLIRAPPDFSSISPTLGVKCFLPIAAPRTATC